MHKHVATKHLFFIDIYHIPRKKNEIRVSQKSLWKKYFISGTRQILLKSIFQNNFAHLSKHFFHCVTQIWGKEKLCLFVKLPYLEPPPLPSRWVTCLLNAAGANFRFPRNRSLLRAFSLTVAGEGSGKEGVMKPGMTGSYWKQISLENSSSLILVVFVEEKELCKWLLVC